MYTIAMSIYLHMHMEICFEVCEYANSSKHKFEKKCLVPFYFSKKLFSFLCLTTENTD
jgi:hypothetical protein